MQHLLAKYLTGMDLRQESHDSFQGEHVLCCCHISSHIVYLEGLPASFLASVRKVAISFPTSTVQPSMLHFPLDIFLFVKEK